MQKPRKRRAAADQLYRTCKVTGDCPEDVVNKVENNTLADRILKYGSLGVFLGSLGIGTGRGTGGAFGYRPLPEAPTSGAVGVRPPVSAIDAIGPDILPVDTVAPTDSVVIPLQEMGGGRVEVIAEVHPVPEGPSLESGTSVDTGGSADVTIPAFRPGQVGRGRANASTTHFHNPAFHGGISGVGTGESSLTEHVLVSEPGTYESIELSDLPAPPKHSTPVSGGAPDGGLPRLFRGRHITHVRVQAPGDLGNPGHLVQYGFENPAFEDDSISFGPIDDIASAPHDDFTDVVHLSRPYFGEGDGGRVRISRLGIKATIQTRSGTYIGPRIHYYQDLSSVSHAPGDLEMQTFTVVSGHDTATSSIAYPVADTYIDGGVLSDTWATQGGVSFTDGDGTGVQIIPVGGRRVTNVHIQVPSVSDLIGDPHGHGNTWVQSGPGRPGAGSVVHMPVEPAYMQADAYESPWDPSVFPKRKKRRPSSLL